MKEKFVYIILLILLVFMIFVIISSGITINKYTDVKNTIDDKISEKRKSIEVKESEYEKLKEENSTKKKQIENMNEYINTLDEKVKQYEK